VGDEQDNNTLSSLDTEQGGPEEPRDRRVSLLLYHRDGTKVIPLQKGTPVVVGRAWPADAVVRDIKLSRRHASFRLSDDGVEVEDLGSTNGTFRNGERIEGGRLTAEDEVTLGSVTVSLHVLTSHEEAAHSALGYDRFATRLEEEVTRSRTFSRPLSLLMIRSVGRVDECHVRHFLPHLRAGGLRPVDLVGLYGPGRVLVALPETSLEAAATLAARLAPVSPPAGVPRLVVGLAAFPTTAATADELLAVARSAARQATTEAPVQGGEPAGEIEGVPRVVVADDRMRRLFETVGKVARSAAPVLVVGETGTGKELVARAIHEESGDRSGGPLRAVNCGAIPSTLIESTLFGHVRGAFTGAEQERAGIFEDAHGGTVFLDEIGELAQAAQAALLRVLETKRVTRVGSGEEIEVDVRVVAATHRDLEAMTEEGGFRQDLLYRLNTIVLDVPPLRERLDDVAPLAELFAAESARASELPHPTIDPAALERLRAFRWPGNVRELRNVIERAVVIADGPSITVEDLTEKVRGAAAGPARPTDGPPPELAAAGVEFKERVKLYETELILDALRRTGGNQTQAAKLLRMPLRTMVHKIRSYGIQKKYDM